MVTTLELNIDILRVTKSKIYFFKYAGFFPIINIFKMNKIFLSYGVIQNSIKLLYFYAINYLVMVIKY